MGEITEESKIYVSELQEKYRKIAVDMLKKSSDYQNDSINFPFSKVESAKVLIDASSYFLYISNLSLNILGIKNENALTDAKRSILKAISIFESLVTNYIDVPFSDYEENLKALRPITFLERYNLIRRLGLAIELTAMAFGEKSKQKWVFTEIYGRFAVIAKNFVEMIVLTRDLFNLESQNHAIAKKYVVILKKIFLDAIDSYILRFETSTNSSDDLKYAMNLANAYVRILTVIDEKDEAATIKKKADYIAERFEKAVEREHQKNKN